MGMVPAEIFNQVARLIWHVRSTTVIEENRTIARKTGKFSPCGRQCPWPQNAYKSSDFQARPIFHVGHPGELPKLCHTTIKKRRAARNLPPPPSSQYAFSLRDQATLGSNRRQTSKVILLQKDILSVTGSRSPWHDHAEAHSQHANSVNIMRLVGADTAVIHSRERPYSCDKSNKLPHKFGRSPLCTPSRPFRLFSSLSITY